MDRPIIKNQSQDKPPHNSKEFISQYKCGTDSSRQLFREKRSNDLSQPDHPLSCCNPKGRTELSPARVIPEVKKVSNEVHNMLLKFVLHGVEIIGDLTAYSIARTKQLVQYGPKGTSSQRYYGSTFNYITSGYLLNHISKLDSVSPKVFLTMGLCDQFVTPHTGKTFSTDYPKILTLLKEKGATSILVMIPPPQLRMSHFSDYEFYQTVRSTIKLTKAPSGLHLALLCMDEYFFTKTESSGDILVNRSSTSGIDSGTRLPNIIVTSKAFDTQPTTRQYFLSHYVVKAMEIYIEQFAQNIDKNQIPTVSQTNERVQSIHPGSNTESIPPKEVSEGDNSEDMGTGFINKMDNCPSTLTLSPVNVDGILPSQDIILPPVTTQELGIVQGQIGELVNQITPQISHELMPIPQSTNDETNKQSILASQPSRNTYPQPFLFMKVTVDTLEIRGLVDTGASIGVIREDICNKIRTSAPLYMRKHRLNSPAIIKVANEETMSITHVISLRFNISRMIQIHSYFVIVPKLSQPLILGVNLFKTYRAVIDLGEGTITFKFPSGEAHIIPAIDTTTQWSGVRLSDMNLDSFIQEDIEFIQASSFQLNEVNDPVEPIRKELIIQIDQAVKSEIITPGQANKALEEILPLAEVFGPHTGSYKWGALNFDLSITQPWKKKQYGIPPIYMTAVRQEIQLMLRNGIIAVSDSEWLHPIVIVPKPDNKAIRICIDAGALNGVLKNIHHDTRKIEGILLEPSTGPLFSSFDFSQGFLQIPLSEQASKYLAFQVEGTTYVYKKLPFGTSVSSSLFNKVVRSVVFRGKPWDEPETSTPNFTISQEYVRTKSQKPPVLIEFLTKGSKNYSSLLLKIRLISSLLIKIRLIQGAFVIFHLFLTKNHKNPLYNRILPNRLEYYSSPLGKIR